MLHSVLLTRLVENLRLLPGIGPKSAQRIALSLLKGNRGKALNLAEVITEAMQRLQPCRSCRMWTEEDECHLCRSPRRNSQSLCVVESPADVLVIEQATSFDGRYFVLMGRLSPLDGMGPEELGLELLAQRLARNTIEELIVATSPTIEGDATAEFIAEMARARGVHATRIAYGVPMGAELEYTDQTTLLYAFNGRQPVPHPED